MPTFDQDFLSYLDSREAFCPAGQIEAVRVLWRRILDDFDGVFPMPIALTAEDGALQLSWTMNQQNVSIDVYGPKHYDWFYRNRVTSVCASGESGSLILASGLYKSLRALRDTGNDVILDGEST